MDYLLQALEDFVEAVGDGSAGVGVDGSGGDAVELAGSVEVDYTVAGVLGAAVDAEDAHCLESRGMWRVGQVAGWGRVEVEDGKASLPEFHRTKKLDCGFDSGLLGHALQCRRKKDCVAAELAPLIDRRTFLALKGATSRGALIRSGVAVAQRSKLRRHTCLGSVVCEASLSLVQILRKIFLRYIQNKMSQ